MVSASKAKPKAARTPQDVVDDGMGIVTERQRMEAAAEIILQNMEPGQRFDAEHLALFDALGWTPRDIRQQQERMSFVGGAKRIFGSFDELITAETKADDAEKLAKAEGNAIREAIADLEQKLKTVDDAARAARQDAHARRGAMVRLRSALLPAFIKTRHARMTAQLNTSFQWRRQAEARIRSIDALLALNPQSVDGSKQIDLSTNHALRAHGTQYTSGTAPALRFAPGAVIPLDMGKVAEWQQELRVERDQLACELLENQDAHDQARREVDSLLNHYTGDAPAGCDVSPVAVERQGRPRHPTAPRGIVPDVAVGPMSGSGMGFTKPVAVEE